MIDTTEEPFRATSVSYNYPSLRVDAGPDHGYEGNFTSGATEISGAVHAAGVSIPLSFKRTTTPPPVPKPLADSDCLPRAGSDLQGRWEGLLGNGPDSVRVVVRISEPSTGKFLAQLDNLTGPWLGQPLLVTFNQPNVQLLVASRAGMFKGELSDDRSQMIGTWLQAGRKSPATFRRAD